MGYGVGACTDYNKQVVVEHPVGQQNEIVAVGYVAVFMPYAQPGFSDNPSYYGLLGGVGTEDYAAADFIGKITQGKNPLGKPVSYWAFSGTKTTMRVIVLSGI